MTNLLRKLLLLLSLFCVSGVSLADTPVYVVEIANFSCPHCLAAESISEDIASAAKRTGGRFVFAPLSWGDQSSWRDRVYYASRNQGDQISALVRKSLFEASQTMSLPLENLSQVMTWLAQDLADTEIDFEQLRRDALSESSQEAMDKALFLASQAAVNRVPTFILIQDGEVVSIFTRSQELPSPTSLKSAVISEISRLSKSG